MKPVEASADPSPPSAWSTRGVARATLRGAVALAAGGALGYLVSHEPRHAPPEHATRPAASMQARTEPSASPAELAIVAPLVPGEALDGWQVQFVHPVREGSMRLTLTQNQRFLHLDIALASNEGPRPPIVAGKYAVFYSSHADPETGQRLTASVARVLLQNAKVPAPPGMTAFRASSPGQ